MILTGFECPTRWHPVTLASPGILMTYEQNGTSSIQNNNTRDIANPQHQYV